MGSSQKAWQETTGIKELTEVNETVDIETEATIDLLPEGGVYKITKINNEK